MFDLSPHDVRLQPISFGSRSCTYFEANIIPLLVKPPLDDGASKEKPISLGRPFLVDLQLFSRERGIIILRDNTDVLLLVAETFRLPFYYRSQE